MLPLCPSPKTFTFFRFVHNVGLEWYRSRHVTSVDDISTLCLICSQSVQLTQKSMENHLRSAHSMSLMHYEEQVSRLSLSLPDLSDGTKLPDAANHLV